jgi:hypothetical protein
MFNKKKRDKQLLENLERVLRGHDIQDTALDEDTRAALEVARKMMDLLQKPSKEYENNLKVQLVYQLLEQEKKEDRSAQGFWSFPRITAWQGTVAAMLLVVISAFIVLLVNNLQLGSPSEETTSPDTTVTGATEKPSVSVPENSPASPSAETDEIGMGVLIQVEKPIYTIGEIVNIQVTMKNESKHSLTIDQFPPRVNIRHIGSGEIVSLAGTISTKISIQPGGTKIFTVNWDTQSVTTTGTYTVEIEQIYSFEKPIELTFSGPIVFEIVSGSE